MTICRILSNASALAICLVAIAAGGLFSFVTLTAILAIGAATAPIPKPAYVRAKKRRPF
jgi:hypothetical protein